MYTVKKHAFLCVAMIDGDNNHSNGLSDKHRPVH